MSTKGGSMYGSPGGSKGFEQTGLDSAGRSRFNQSQMTSITGGG